MSTETAAVSVEHIVKTPGTCGGRPRIKDHRITVENIVIEHETKGRRPEEIAEGYPGITMADVYAALSYYHDHREEIDSDIAETERLFEELRGRPSVLEELRANRATTDVSRDAELAGPRP